MRAVKEVILRLEKEMSNLDGRIGKEYWMIQGLNKAWEICHKVDDEKTITQDAYRECFEEFIPIEKWDEATKFLSTYVNGLAQDFENKEDKINHKK